MTAKTRAEDAARAAKAVADRWRTVTGFYVSDAGNRVVIRLRPAQADAVLDDVIRGRAATDGGDGWDKCIDAILDPDGPVLHSLSPWSVDPILALRHEPLPDDEGGAV